MEQALFTSAHRVPIPDGSLCDLQFSTKKPVDTDPVKAVEKINKVIADAAAGPYQGIIEYSTDPLVSVDVMGNTHSAIFDAELTQAIDSTFFKVSVWFDNEIGYANRVIDVILKLDSLGRQVWA